MDCQQITASAAERLSEIEGTAGIDISLGGRSCADFGNSTQTDSSAITITVPPTVTADQLIAFQERAHQVYLDVVAPALPAAESLRITVTHTAPMIDLEWNGGHVPLTQEQAELIAAALAAGVGIELNADPDSARPSVASADGFRSVQVVAFLDGADLTTVDDAQQDLADGLTHAEAVGVLFDADAFVQVRLVSDDPVPTISTIRLAAVDGLATDSAWAGVVAAGVAIAELPEVASVGVNLGEFPLAAVYLDGDLGPEGDALVAQLQAAIDDTGHDGLEV